MIIANKAKGKKNVPQTLARTRQHASYPATRSKQQRESKIVNTW